MEAGGVEVLIDANRRKPNIKNCVEEATEAEHSFCSGAVGFGPRFVFLTNRTNKGSLFLHPVFVASICLWR